MNDPLFRQIMKIGGIALIYGMLYGFIFPQLISSNSDGLVLLGSIGAFLVGPAYLFVLIYRKATQNEDRY